MSLSSIYSTIQLYVQIYTRTHSYIKDGHEIPPNVFHSLFSHKSIISMHKFFVATFIKTIHNFRNHDNLETELYQRNRGGHFEEPEHHVNQRFRILRRDVPSLRRDQSKHLHRGGVGVRYHLRQKEV